METIQSMNLKDKLTIVIPCKNEENYIGRTLKGIYNQNCIQGIKVIIADANSTDNTRKIISEAQENLKDKLKITLIDGGSVSYGRNKGSELCDTKYILFLDADTVLYNPDTINGTMKLMYKKRLDLLTCKIKCYSPDFKAKLGFFLFNIINKQISKITPFAVGMYFLTNKDIFRLNGGFNEDYQHSEDYCLSRLYNPIKFKVSKYFVGQDNRRFKKFGYLGMLKLVIKGFLNRHDKEFFKQDVGYWK
jgi:glycosyltransferase involved in cell wall biosynthesis